MNYAGGFIQQQPNFDMNALGQNAQYGQPNTWAGGAPGNGQIPTAATIPAHQFQGQAQADSQASQQLVGPDVATGLRQFEKKVDAFQAGGTYQSGYYPNTNGGYAAQPWPVLPSSQPQQWPPQQPVSTAPAASVNSGPPGPSAQHAPSAAPAALAPPIAPGVPVGHTLSTAAQPPQPPPPPPPPQQQQQQQQPIWTPTIAQQQQWAHGTLQNQYQHQQHQQQQQPNQQANQQQHQHQQHNHQQNQQQQPQQPQQQQHNHQQAPQLTASRDASTGLPSSIPAQQISPSTRTSIGPRESTPRSGPGGDLETRLPPGFLFQTLARDPAHTDVTVQLLFSGEIEFVVVNSVAGQGGSV